MKKIIPIAIIILFFAVGFFLYESIVKVPTISDVVEEKVEISKSPSEQLGQNFIVGLQGAIITKNEKRILEKIKPAGIVLYARNFENPKQLKELILQLQVIAQKTTVNPYFIMIDEEPGGAVRLGVFENIFAFGQPDWQLINRGAEAMHEVGINVDLAPIADLDFNADSFIKERVPTHDASHLADFNKEFIDVLAKNNILSTLKHFPGMGVFVQDPHQQLPIANPEESVMSTSKSIFKKGINAGADFVMTCHCVYDSIDKDNPATMSKKITTDMLRGEVGFKGLAITDDLSEMPFIMGKNMDLIEATGQAINAGHNLVMFSHKLEVTEKIFDKLLSVLENDAELQTLVLQNYKKVITLKKEKLK